MIFHIRRPLRRARGNSFYRDRSDRGQGTFCGAAETIYDVTHKDRMMQFGDRKVCPECRALRDGKGAKLKEITP